MKEYMAYVDRRVLSRKVIVLSRSAMATMRCRRTNEISIAVTLLDIKIPGPSGLQVLEKVRSLDNRAVVIMITAFGSIEVAVESMRRGAFDLPGQTFRDYALGKSGGQGLIGPGEWSAKIMFAPAAR